MPINAKLNIPEQNKNIAFGDTVINWNFQRLEFNYNGNQIYIHQLTEPQWNYLVSGLQTLMNQIPGISDIEIPDFNPNL